MSSVQFDFEQSLYDSLHTGYVKKDDSSTPDEPNSANNFFNLPGFPTTADNNLEEFPSFFSQSGSLNMDDVQAFNTVVPSLDSEETPGSIDSVSLSPQSPISSATSVFNPSFDFGNNVNGPSMEDIPSLGGVAEKRKASVAPGDDVKRSAKTSKTGTGKKPGRKADNSEPANKKKAQNRAAQRAFRERKERHLKELEDRVSELETESHVTSSENTFLRQQVERLQGELKKYRSSRNAKSSIPISNSGVSSSPKQEFTFEFPFFQRSQISSTPNHAKSSRSNSDGSSPSSLLSPTSALGSVSSVSSSHSPVHKNSCAPREQEEETFCEQLNLACGNKENPVPRAASKSKGETPLLISALHTSRNDSNQSSFSSGSRPSNAFEEIAPPVFELDFLSEYRDPIFDGEEFSLPDLTTENSLFDPFGAPHDFETRPSEKSGALKLSQEEEEKVPASQALLTCTAVWDRISSHPKFGDLDIDGLCAELRTKAKCSETGVVLTESDVNNVLKTLA